MPAKLHHLKSSLDTAVRDLVADETGVGVVEIILIMIVLISLVVIFKKQVTQIVKDILSKAASDAEPRRRLRRSAARAASRMERLVWGTSSLSFSATAGSSPRTAPLPSILSAAWLSLLERAPRSKSSGVPVLADFGAACLIKNHSLTMVVKRTSTMVAPHFPHSTVQAGMTIVQRPTGRGHPRNRPADSRKPRHRASGSIAERTGESAPSALVARVVAMANTVKIPTDMLPEDGRFGSGPSKIRPEQIAALDDGATNLLGTSHRQTPVRQLVGSIREGLASFFNVPDGYEIALGNGGASCFWEIACASLITRQAAFGTYGSFSAKFAKSAAKAPFLEDPVIYEGEPGTYRLPELTEYVDTYCWAHNETSTGVAAPVRRIEGSVEQGALTLIDATSAAGALPVDISQTDAYYFSPQKAFGADGGLWVAVLSPAAVSTWRASSVKTAAPP